MEVVTPVLVTLARSPWNGEPGASERLSTRDCAEGVALPDAGRLGTRGERSPPESATLRRGCPESRVPSGRFGSLETLQPERGRLRSQEEAGVTLRVATVAAGSLRSLGG